MDEEVGGDWRGGCRKVVAGVSPETGLGTHDGIRA